MALHKRRHHASAHFAPTELKTKAPSLSGDENNCHQLSSITPFLLLLPLFPEAASSEAKSVDSLFFFLLAVCGSVAALVVCLLIYFAIRYRRRSADQLAEGAPTVTWMEIGWSIAPLMIFILTFVWGVKLYFGAVRPPNDTVEINVGAAC